MLLIASLGAPAFAGADAVESLLRAGDVPAALDAAREAVAVDPRDAESHELLVDILLNLGLGETARLAYAGLVDEHPEDALYVYLLGRATPDADRARAAYNRALDLDPGLGRAWMGLASVDRAEGKLMDASVKYHKALALDPSLIEAWGGLRLIANTAGDRDTALELSLETMRAVPDDPDAYLAAAMLQPEMAGTYLAKGAAAAPDDPRLQAALGRQAAAAGDLYVAREALTRALSIVFDAGLTLELAVVEARLAGTLDDRGVALLDQGRALAAQGRAGDALLTLDGATARYPETFLSWYARGNLLADQRDDAQLLAQLGAKDPLASAESDLRRALELAPESVDVQAALGLVLYQRAQPDEAAALLTSASLQRPWDVQLGLAAAKATLEIPDDPRGPRMLEALVEAHPTDARTWLALAEQRSASGDLQGAYDVLIAGAQRVRDPAVVVALAAAATDLGRTDQAAALLQKLGEASGSQAILDTAARLRAVGAAP